MLNRTQNTTLVAGKHKSLQERSRRQKRLREQENHASSIDHVASTPKELEQKRSRHRKKINKPIDLKINKLIVIALKYFLSQSKAKILTGEPAKTITIQNRRLQKEAGDQWW